MKNRNFFKIIIYFLPAFFWMALIFYFSSLTGSESSEQSSPIVESLLSIFHLNPTLTHFLTLLVRKSAHVFEYFILFFLFLFGLFKSKLVVNKQVFYSALFTLIYASFDEFHQLFVPNRSAEFTDIIIDSIGIILALVITWLFKIIKKKRRN